MRRDVKYSFFLFKIPTISCLKILQFSVFQPFATNALEMPNFREGFATNRKTMDSFIGIRFKKKVAKRFQEFSEIFQYIYRIEGFNCRFFRINWNIHKRRIGSNRKTNKSQFKETDEYDHNNYQEYRSNSNLN